MLVLFHDRLVPGKGIRKECATLAYDHGFPTRIYLNNVWEETERSQDGGFGPFAPTRSLLGDLNIFSTPLLFVVGSRMYIDYEFVLVHPSGVPCTNRLIDNDSQIILELGRVPRNDQRLKSAKYLVQYGLSLLRVHQGSGKRIDSSESQDPPSALATPAEVQERFGQSLQVVV